MEEQKENNFEDRKEVCISPKRKKKKVGKFNKNLEDFSISKKTSNKKSTLNNTTFESNEDLDPVETFNLKITEKPLLIILNKQDLKNKITEDYIALYLGLYKLKNIKWQIKKTSCITGEGIFDCMEWVIENMKIKEDLIKNASRKKSK